MMVNVDCKKISFTQIRTLLVTFFSSRDSKLNFKEEYSAIKNDYRKNKLNTVNDTEKDNTQKNLVNAVKDRSDLDHIGAPSKSNGIRRSPSLETLVGILKNISTSSYQFITEKVGIVEKTPIQSHHRLSPKILARQNSFDSFASTANKNAILLSPDQSHSTSPSFIASKGLFLLPESGPNSPFTPLTHSALY